MFHSFCVNTHWEQEHLNQSSVTCCRLLGGSTNGTDWPVWNRHWFEQPHIWSDSSWQPSHMSWLTSPVVPRATQKRLFVRTQQWRASDPAARLSACPKTGLWDFRCVLRVLLQQKRQKETQDFPCTMSRFFCDVSMWDFQWISTWDSMNTEKARCSKWNCSILYSWSNPTVPRVCTSKRVEFYEEVVFGNICWNTTWLPKAANKDSKRFVQRNLEHRQWNPDCLIESHAPTARGRKGSFNTEKENSGTTLRWAGYVLFACGLI